MEIKVETLSPVKKKINFEIPADQVALEIDKAYENIRRRASIKGFRKGKAPQSFIEKHYGDVMSEDVFKALVNDTYFKALVEAKIYPVSHPVIEGDELKRGESFRYSAVVEVLPEIEVKDYEGMELLKERYVPDDETIERRLQEMRENMAQLQPVTEDRGAVAGDFVTIDFKGFVDGVPFEQGEASDFQLELGSGRFIPGFEEQVCGMKVGEEREITVTFPEKYGKEELAGKEAMFVVMVKEIKFKELPELNDDFAREFGEFDSLADLRGQLVELHEKQERQRIESELRERLVKRLIERNELEVPEALVERQLQVMLDNTKKRLSYQRLSLEMMGMDEDGYKTRYRSTAIDQVKGSLLLEAVASQEGLKVEESDLEARIAEIAQDSGESPEKVRSYYMENERAKDNLAGMLREEKTIGLLLDKAKITEVGRGEIKD